MDGKDPEMDLSIMGNGGERSGNSDFTVVAVMGKIHFRPLLSWERSISHFLIHCPWPAVPPVWRSVIILQSWVATLKDDSAPNAQ